MKISQSRLSCLKKYGKICEKKINFLFIKSERLKLNEVHKKIPLSWSTENFFKLGFKKLFKYFYIFQADWAYQIWHWQRLKNNKKKMRERRWFFLRYKLYGTCHVSLIVQQQQQRRWRWRQQSVKNAGNGLQGLYNMASTPIFQLRLVCQLMREIFFFFLSFRFAGKFNSCGNSVNLKGAAAPTHGNTRTRAKTRATPLATRPVCQQGSLYPFDRAA